MQRSSISYKLQKKIEPSGSMSVKMQFQLVSLLLSSNLSISFAILLTTYLTMKIAYPDRYSKYLCMSLFNMQWWNVHIMMIIDVFSYTLRFSSYKKVKKRESEQAYY